MTTPLYRVIKAKVAAPDGNQKPSTAGEWKPLGEALDEGSAIPGGPDGYAWWLECSNGVVFPFYDLGEMERLRRTADGSV